MPPIILLDNTVLTNFALVDGLNLLSSLGNKTVFIPAAVVQEYEVGIQLGRVPGGAEKNLKVVHLTFEEQAYAEGFSTRLGAGERACLAVCFFRRGIFASDDRDARSQAQRLHIAVIGTIGILVLSVRNKVIEVNKAQEILDQMIASGYLSPVTRINDLFTD